MTTLPLFVYAQLKLKGQGDPVCVLGDLRRRGADAAAIFGPDASTASTQAGGSGLVWGQLLPDSDALMQQLDRTERPEYIRVMVRVVQSGEAAWAYEYVSGQRPFLTLPIITTGDF